MSAASAGGCRVHVFIATTEGPVAVQKITAEDPDVPSVACLDGTTEILAISRDYTRFVDRGTGLVARLTGHGAYRLDLDRPVDGGRSWQLPVLLAHLLDAEDRLAGSDEPADLTLLATGEVDREQRVRPVGRLDRKLSAARALIDRHVESGRPLVVLVPDDGEAHDLLASRLPDGGDGVVRLLAWKRVEDLAALRQPGDASASAPHPRPLSRRERGENRPSPGRSEVVPPPSRSALPHPAPHSITPATGASPRDRIGGKWRPRVPRGWKSVKSAGPPGHAGGRRRPRVYRPAGALPLLLLLIAAGAGIAAWWTGPRHWEALRRAGDYEALDRMLAHALVQPLAERYRGALRARVPPPESLVFGVVERRTAGVSACPDRTARGTGRDEDLVETSLNPMKPGFFRSQRGMSLCQAVYRVANESEHLVYLYFGVRPVLPARADGERVDPLHRAAALPPGASLTLDLGLVRQPIPPFGADLLILAVPSPAPQLRRAFEAAMAGEESAGDAGGLDLTALPDLGLVVKGASHAILR